MVSVRLVGWKDPKFLKHHLFPRNAECGMQGPKRVQENMGMPWELGLLQVVKLFGFSWSVCEIHGFVDLRCQLVRHPPWFPAWEQQIECMKMMPSKFNRPHYPILLVFPPLVAKTPQVGTAPYPSSDFRARKSRAFANLRIFATIWRRGKSSSWKASSFAMIGKTQAEWWE